MLERFSTTARQSVRLAQDEARRLRHPVVGPEHLLYGLAAQPEGLAAQALLAQGVDAERVHRALVARDGHDDDPLDEDALATLGIDLEVVRRVTEASFGPGALESRTPIRTGHLPLTRPGRKVLELAVRETVNRRDERISSGHMLLGLLRAGGVAGKFLADAGVDVAALRADVLRRFPGQAA